MKQLWLRTRLVFSAFLPALWRHLPAKWRGTILIIRDGVLPTIWVCLGVLIADLPGWARVLLGVVAGMYLFRFIATCARAAQVYRRRKAGITLPAQPPIGDRTLQAVAGLVDGGEFEVAVMTGSGLTLPQRQAAMRAIRGAVEAEQRLLSQRSMT